MTTPFTLLIQKFGLGDWGGKKRLWDRQLRGGSALNLKHQSIGSSGGSFASLHLRGKGVTRVDKFFASPPSYL